MESSHWGQIIGIAVLVLMSGYFSGTETAFTSVNKIKLKNLADKGNHRAELALNLANDYDKLLSTILIGNNIVNIAMTAVATVLFMELLGEEGPTVATIVITIVVLIFGEISPKGIAKEVPEGVCLFSAPIIKVIMTILTPFIIFFSGVKNLIKKIFRVSSDNGITEEELITIVEEAKTEGGIEEEQGDLIQNAISFNEFVAEDVLTPRVDIQAIENNEDNEEIAKIFRETGFSRLPVYENDLDNILGVLNQKDFYNYVYNNKHNDIASFVKPVVYVANSMKIANLLRKMQDAKTHIAIVIDEYGGTAGLVTMEDIIEEIVGEIYDEHDMILSEEITLLQNGSYRVLANSNLEKAFDYFGFSLDEDIDVTTVNGWVVTTLDKLPQKGDKFEQINGNNLIKVRVTKSDGKKAIEINMTIEKIINDGDKNDM